MIKTAIQLKEQEVTMTRATTIGKIEEVTAEVMVMMKLENEKITEEVNQVVMKQ